MENSFTENVIAAATTCMCISVRFAHKLATVKSNVLKNQVTSTHVYRLEVTDTHQRLNLFRNKSTPVM